MTGISRKFYSFSNFYRKRFPLKQKNKNKLQKLFFGKIQQKNLFQFSKLKIPDAAGLQNEESDRIHKKAHKGPVGRVDLLVHRRQDHSLQPESEVILR